MAKDRVLFIVHGMGEADEAWVEGIADDLSRYAAGYGLADAWDRVDVVPVLYNRVFDAELKILRQRTSDLEELAGSALGSGAGGRFVEWASRLPGPQEDFFWQSAMDVMMYRYHAGVRANVQQTVVNKIQQTLGRAWVDPKPRVHILAHSLGTAVTHDCLAILGSSTEFGSGFYSAKSFRHLFEAVYMVANVSRVVQHDQWGDGTLNVYESVVHPIPDGARRDPYCEKYWNFNHRHDPIPQVHAFKPRAARWAESGRFLQPQGIEHFIDMNTHALENYLANPRVHIPILNTLLADAAGRGSPIPAGVAKPAITDFERRFAIPPGLPETIAGVAEGAMNVAKSLLDSTRSPDPALALVALATTYFSLFPPASGGRQ